MPRELVLGNGHLLVNFDRNLNMRDLYYPYVGHENHIGGHRNATGVWVEGKFSWLDEPGWQKKVAYLEDTLVSNVEAAHSELGLSLKIRDAVHFHHNLYLKEIVLCNMEERPREVRFFFHHDFNIDGSEVGDTAVYDPTINALYHYKRDRYFLFNGQVGEEGIFQFAVGTKRFRGAEGTWRDAEDGLLSGNAIAQGSVDSVLSFRCHLKAGEKETLYYWLVVGRSFGEVCQWNHYTMHLTPGRLLKRVERYWRSWLCKEERDFYDLPEKVASLYRRSLLIIRTQVDQRGAILAANDSDILKEARDHYSYVWPRDGALVADAVSRAGYPELIQEFFNFCSRVLTEGGYLLHKYNPDGSVGSSWHPWLLEGRVQLPIQEDETALVLWALWTHYQSRRELEFIDSLYRPLVMKTADFLASYRDPKSGLPFSSYDLWEERRGVFTFTASAVYGGLAAAANLARLFGDEPRVERYASAATEVKEAILKHLYSENLGRFIRGLDAKGEPDLTLESSVFGVAAFGVLPASDPRMEATMQKIREGLWVKTPVGGVARYTGDYYFRRSDDLERVPGNPWFICTLWLSQWYAARASNTEELGEARALLEWAANHALESGVLPEQLHPYSGAPLSVAPLTWSHSALVGAVLDYLKKARQLGVRSGLEGNKDRLQGLS